MTKYEYDFEIVNLSEQDVQKIQLGLATPESMNNVIKEVLNERASDGWEPLMPVGIPSIWFRRAVTARRKTAAKAKAVAKE